MNDLNRREFVAAVACAACLCGLGGATKALAQDMGGGAPAEPATTPSTLDAGLKSDYAQDGITKTWMKAPNHAAIVRHQGKIFALTTVCTHRGGTLREADDQVSFKCPRHGATFDIDGNVTGPPAKRPLTRYAISVDSNGHVIVDLTTSYTSDQWSDPASFIAVS
jgi:cytochrome b6-f complex iron-sulfur subunit